MQDLRSLVRQVLAEELAALRQESGAGRPRVTEEAVALRTNGELAAFVDRLMRLARDPAKRADIESGRHVFRLESGGSGAGPVGSHSGPAPKPRGGSVAFDKGLVTEREVAKLPDGTARLKVGTTVRLTPLASDELRRRGITIERMKP